MKYPLTGTISFIGKVQLATTRFWLVKTNLTGQTSSHLHDIDDNHRQT